MNKQDIFDIDFSKHLITKEEIEQERLETYNIFRDGMKSLNENYSEDLIKDLFKVKFGYLPNFN